MAIIAPILYGLAGLGTLAQGADSQGLFDETRAEGLEDLSEILSATPSLQRARARESVAGLESLADLVEMQATRFDPVEIDPELATLISGYEDMIQEAKGKTRPSLRAAYARLGIGV